MQLLRLAVALIALASLSLSQTDRGIITGTVTDSSGAAVPEAKVTASNTATGVNFATVTTGSGDFTIPTLPVGTYQLRVEKQGFKSAYVPMCSSRRAQQPR